MGLKTESRVALANAPDSDHDCQTTHTIPDPSTIQRRRIERLAIACAAQHATEINDNELERDLAESLADGKPRWIQVGENLYHDALRYRQRSALNASIQDIYRYDYFQASKWLDEFNRASCFSDEALDALVRGTLASSYVVVVADSAHDLFENQVVRGTAYDAERIRRQLKARSA